MPIDYHLSQRLSIYLPQKFEPRSIESRMKLSVPYLPKDADEVSEEHADRVGPTPVSSSTLV